jgi:hypothetical protein
MAYGGDGVEIGGCFPPYLHVISTTSNRDKIIWTERYRSLKAHRVEAGWEKREFISFSNGDQDQNPECAAQKRAMHIPHRSIND